MKSSRIIVLIGGLMLLSASAWWIVHHAGTSSSQSAAKTSISDRVGAGRSVVADPIRRQAPAALPNASTRNEERATGPVPTAANRTGGPHVDSRPAIPANIRPIVEAVPGMKFSQRVKLVHALRRQLTEEELLPLYDYLRTPSSAESANREFENWLRNAVMDKLVRQDDAPAGLADLLLGVYQDRSQDVVMRDYAIQHMPPAYEKFSAAEKSSVQPALWQATGETDSSIAGTALLALLEVTGGSSSTSTANPADSDGRSQLAQTALRLAADDQCGELSRITAISLCGRLGIKESLPMVTKLARSAPSVPLQIAAIAALGQVGDASTGTFLQQMAAGTDKRLQPAAVTALQYWNGRIKN